MKTRLQKVNQRSVYLMGTAIILTLLLAGCAAQPAVQEPDLPPESEVYFAFDFDVDQRTVPFPDYGAAYIVNVSHETISIPLLTWENTTMFDYFFYDEIGIRPIFTEMMLARVNRNPFLILQPGDRVLAFSVAFFHENLEEYPNAIYEVRVVINGETLYVRGIVR